MDVKSYNIWQNLCGIFDIQFDESIAISDQELDIKPLDCQINNKGFGGFKHTEETKQLLRGKIAPNKGISNPNQRLKMLTNNPMKNPEIAKRVAIKNKRKISWNRGPNYMPPKPVKFCPDGRKITKWIFPNGDIIISYHIRKTCEKLGLSFSSIRHKIDKGPYINGKYKGLEIKNYPAPKMRENQNVD